MMMIDGNDGDDGDDHDDDNANGDDAVDRDMLTMLVVQDTRGVSCFWTSDGQTCSRQYTVPDVPEQGRCRTPGGGD